MNWKCDKITKVEQVTKKIILWKLKDFQQILIIHLKRFINNKKGFSTKINNLVTFPINELDIADFSYTSESILYDLYSVVNHYGNRNGGHYTAYCKNPDNKWYEYNDDDVTEVDVKNIVTPFAYILFYIRK